MTRSVQKLVARAGVLLLCTVACATALAAPGAQDADIFTGRYLLQVAASLIFVLGCLLGVLYLLKRMNGGAVTNRKGLQVLASMKVGTREKIVLLRAGESQLLVGVAAGSVRTLHVFEEGRGFDEVLSRVGPEAGS